MWYREISKPQEQVKVESTNASVDIESKVGSWIKSQEPKMGTIKETEMSNAVCNQYF